MQSDLQNLVTESKAETAACSKSGGMSAKDDYVETKNSTTQDLPKEPLAPQPWTTPLKWLLPPYILGIIWLCLHPIVSIVTGELKCRGYFVDEKALLQSNFVISPYKIDQLTRFYSDNKQSPESYTGMCHALQSTGLLRAHRIDCYRHEQDGYDYASIVPTNVPTLPNEAIVLIVKSPSGDASWTTSYVHVALMNMLDRLSDEVSSPWLAKNIILVSPSAYSLCRAESNETTATICDDQLQSVVSSFADSYLLHRSSCNSLPLQDTLSIIRNVLVLDIDQISQTSQHMTTSLDLYILPQGRRGVLPNLDFVSVMVDVFQKQSWTTFHKVRLHIHPPFQIIRRILRHAKPHVSPAVYGYLKDLSSMFGFARTLAFGPYVALSLYAELVYL